MATLVSSDLEFILQQILIAERHAAIQADNVTYPTQADKDAAFRALFPNSFSMLGLRTVDGSYNNLVPGQQNFGAADQPFPSLMDPVFRNENDELPTFGVSNTDYGLTASVVDSDPRIISNLIVDQTITNPAAVEAFVAGGFGVMVGPVLHYLNADGSTGDPVPSGVTLTIPNTAPDEGLSAGFNSWFVFFGQFFDHGLDFIQRSTETVIIPLAADDPIFTEHPDAPPFMIIERTLKDADGAATNHTTSFVDQNQTYTSHPSHQVFLREYVLANGTPVATGRLIQGDNGGMATWADVKEQARTILGIELTDQDVGRVPLVYTDAYGNFIPGANGLPQLITGTLSSPVLVPGNLTTPVAASSAIASGHAFIIDIAHAANPTGKTADTDSVTGLANADGSSTAANYDDELLDAHFMAGDGRANENIALTTVHHIFHSEHNRQIDEIKTTLIAGATTPAGLGFLNDWLTVDVAAVPVDLSTLVWDGERLFQAAKFATEMQYQHLVFEEFARKVQPNVDEFLQYDASIDPSILAEFAHTVYRFGHSMLTETVDRFDPSFVSSEMGLIEAFLNPLAFDTSGTINADAAAGAIVRGTTRQLGNEVDEFVTEALRNNLLGLPLDLATINIARGREAGVPSLQAARAEFFRGTGDSQLRPYESWADFAAHLKHPESLVNFIAAYGTHTSITTAVTLAEKRAAADLLVFGGAGEPVDRLDFLNSRGAWASNLPPATTLPKDIDGFTTTGLGNVDFWIGGLAERQMPFGGLLGSTFNFVFETQLEALQNGDRFYYLGRLQGLSFLAEMENNSFAKLIMQNTNATHLPGDVFSTPTWILEVNQSEQFNDSNGDGALDSLDPVGGTELLPLVIRDNPATVDNPSTVGVDEGLDSNYLRYTGADHVVLGGTSGNDIIISSEGDDTLYGDAGNDRLEGGDGNDIINGGDGDDIITDKGGDDTIRAGKGNDVIHGGNGLNLIIGDDGNDFIITGEDVSDTFGGRGNDFIYGAKTNLPTLGNEGDDWIELGTQDGAPGDNSDLGLNSDRIAGHDVFVGGGGFDEMLAEGGDDIMVGSEGEDHFDGGSGFDWGIYKNDQRGVVVDLLINDFVEPLATPSNAGIMDRFAFVEGLSGSNQADVLRGDNQEFADLLLAGARGSILDAAGIARIAGLQQLLGTGVTTFGAGNILLGGDGSDIIEGRGGNDIIDGERWLNVRISVRANADGSGAEVNSFDSMAGRSTLASDASGKTLIQHMLDGTYNPGQLVIEREILTSAGPNDFDTAVYSGRRADYTIFTAADGTTTVTDTRVVGLNPVTGITTSATDGIDTLRGIERLQFADVAVVLPLNGTLANAGPVGQLAVTNTTSANPNAVPRVNDVLRVSSAAVTDANNVGGGGLGARPVTYYWQAELNPGSGVFEDIILDVGGSPSIAHGTTFRVTADLAGLNLRARAVYKDDAGTLENVYSPPTADVTGVLVVAPTAPPPPESETTSAGNGVHFIRSDLDLILQHIKIAEGHTDGGGTLQALTGLLPNSRVAFGLRTVDGSFNNLVPGQENFGAADQDFPSQIPQQFRDVNGTAPGGNYASTVTVVDAAPRIISNLIVDQTADNPAAVAANGGAAPVVSPGPDGIFGTTDDVEVFLIENATPDAALSAQFNSWFTFFGQFFDHGLDLVDKGGNGNVFIPLLPDDPLFVPGSSTNFMIVTRATNEAVLPGADRVLGTSDDIHRHNNETTPFVDQNQTYTSHASHQVFLREYDTVDGVTVATGRLLDGANGGIANWAEVKASAATFLGIQLTDADVLDAPLLATDLYGKFIPGPNGFAQFVVPGAPGGLVEANPADDGGLGTLVPAGALRSGHAFLNDIAHTAAPVIVGGVLQNDPDSAVGNPVPVGSDGNNLQYDDELLDKHFITGDGRGNENIGLTAVHFVFHAEHNRLAEHVKDVAIASNDAAFASEWLLTAITQTELSAVNALTGQAKADAIDALNWNGERIFQAARFGTEMQYQHLVFEEFARKIQPQVDVFFAATQVYDTAINPAIVAEFAHVVYRFGHSMLTETIDRYDPAFNVIDGDPLHPGQDASNHQIGLIAAFLNPIAFTASGATDAAAAGAIIRGVTRQAGNEIDEFVTEALRNNLVGLPLDLPAINIARGRDTGVPTLNQARTEFYAMTGDSQLKPYTSWADFAANIKHPESLINFIAAYGTHASITSATTTLAKRAAATALVLNTSVTIDPDNNPLTDNSVTFAPPTDRLAFLNATGAYAGGSLGGLNDVDLWIGGLAEKQMPFGGLLGSTFNFVFETQMEKLQDGDRFYYLERTAGMNFLTELENNSFAKLIMANTNATHLPGDVFSTPAFTLEVDQTKQFTLLNEAGPDGVQVDDPSTTGNEEADNVIGLDGIANNSDPDGQVIRNNSNHLQYTGEDHVVLGGTDGNDVIVSSIGDDTLYGDGGDDRLEGGDGVDMILGGTGDDIITDMGGDDNLQGQDGDDAIHGGNGINLILGGFGSDFIVTGEDSSEAFGGVGNDFIRGGRANEVVRGNEGDDWIEGGMVDGEAGDNFDPFGRDIVIGNDVFIGDSVTDRMDGEGGDDIMVGNGGEGDRYEGASGFDWAVFKDAPSGTTADLNLRAFDETPVPRSEAIMARFTSVEGLSGSAHSDFLRGDDRGPGAFAPVPGAVNGDVLTNIALIEGLQRFLNDLLDGDPNQAGDQSVTSFGDGNIILGGAGSDLIEGRAGNDLIDGDLWLNVRIGGVDKTGASIGGNITSMDQIMTRVFAGEIDPGALRIVREILDGTTTHPAEQNFDTAIFSGELFDADGDPLYEIRVTNASTGVTRVALDPSVRVDDPNAFSFTIGADDIVTVIGLDGTDTLRNIERLQFSDRALVINGSNRGPIGSLAVAGTPLENQALTVSLGSLRDPDNPNGGLITGPISYIWQEEVADGVFEDIAFANENPDTTVAVGSSYTPGDAQVGARLRVKAIYKDANGVIETVYSAPTAPVGNVNDAPIGVALISDTTPTETQAIIAVPQIIDPDGMINAVLTYQWQQANAQEPGGGGAGWTNITGISTSPLFTPGAAQVNRELRVIVRYTDDNGTNETVISAPTIVVGDVINDGGGGNTLTGTEGQDIINGGGGNDIIVARGEADVLNGGGGADTINAGTGNDRITGGTGADTLNGEAGNDFFFYTIGDGADAINGGAETDSVVITGTGGNNTLNVLFNGSALTGIGGGTLTDVEFVSADLLGNGGAGDTLSYAGSTGAVTVNLALGTASGFTGTPSAAADGLIPEVTARPAIANIENVTGGDGSDTLVGDGNANTLSGGIGSDTLTGGAGSDELNGNAGNDRFIATVGDGNDEINGNGGTDTYDLSATTAGATVDTDEATSADIGTDDLAGIENVIGSQGNDTITFNGGINVIDGQGGNDTINAGGGNDTVTGGTGNDTMNGGGGQDNFVFATGFGADVINGFDANPGGGQDRLDITSYGFDATMFASRVTIQDLGDDTRVTIGSDTIVLRGVNGIGANVITQDDFIF